MLAAEGFRLDAVDALRAVLVRSGDTAPLENLLSAIDSAAPSSSPETEGGVEALRHTITSEALLGCKVLRTRVSAIVCATRLTYYARTRIHRLTPGGELRSVGHALHAIPRTLSPRAAPLKLS